MRDRDAESAPRAADLPSGFDEHDPYKDADLDSYPDWWRQSIAEFKRHGMRPYRPAQFSDGMLVKPLIEDLEARLGVTITLRAVDARIGDDWKVEIDGEELLAVPRERTGGGYTEYALTSNTLVTLVQETVCG